MTQNPHKRMRWPNRFSFCASHSEKTSNGGYLGWGRGLSKRVRFLKTSKMSPLAFVKVHFPPAPAIGVQNGGSAARRFFCVCSDKPVFLCWLSLFSVAPRGAKACLTSPGPLVAVRYLSIHSNLASRVGNLQTSAESRRQRQSA